jgi:hypothetical protein
MDEFSGHPLYRKHDLDSVMSSLWSFYMKYFLALFLASFLVNIAIQYLSSSIDMSKMTSMTDPFEMLAEFKTWLWPMTGAIVISILLSVILQYYVLYKPVNSEVDILNSIYKSLKYILPLIVIMILFMIFAAVAMVAGFIVFIIGALFSVLYIFMIGLFIMPILMAEGNNIGNTISRTFTLSHRHFGSNLGWTAIILLIIIVGSIIISSLVLIPFSGSFFKLLRDPEAAAEALNFVKNPWYIILSALAGAIFTPLTPILSAILYFNARAREKDLVIAVGSSNEPDKVRVEDLYAKPYSEDHPDNPVRNN